MKEENIKPSIIIFSTAYFPFVGGAEIAVKEITGRINDFQFDMVTARLNGKLPKFEKMGNVGVHRVGFGVPTLDKYLLPFLSCLKVGSLHKEKHYCVLWSIMASYAGFGALFFKIFHPKIPFFLTLQEGDSEGHILKRVGIFYPFWKKIFKKADFIQTISHYLADFARRHGAVCPVEVAPNGADLKKFSTPKDNKLPTGRVPDSQFSKSDLNLKDDDKVIITTSRLVEKNGISDLIESLRYLNDNVKLLILGAGPLEENLKLKTRNLNLENRVIFLGYIDHKETAKYLKISDIFIRPSLSEGMGNSFIEAMAAGIPVIGTSVGGIVDFLKDGETGLFCKVRDPKSIAEKAGVLLEDSRLKKRIVSSARKLVFEKYDWNKISDQIDKLLTKISRRVL